MFAAADAFIKGASHCLVMLRRLKGARFIPHGGFVCLGLVQVAPRSGSRKVYLRAEGTTKFTLPTIGQPRLHLRRISYAPILCLCLVIRAGLCGSDHVDLIAGPKGALLAGTAGAILLSRPHVPLS